MRAFETDPVRARADVARDVLPFVPVGLLWLLAMSPMLLGDRVLQNLAWKAAVLLGWPNTYDAEYVALTQLHADALITLG